MANTTGKLQKGQTKPTLTAMAVNDVKTITGNQATVANIRSLTAARSGKLYTVRRSARKTYVITRIK